MGARGLMPPGSPLFPGTSKLLRPVPLADGSAMLRLTPLISVLMFTVLVAADASADEPSSTANTRPKRLLLLGQKPDNHPFGSHEYMAAARLMAKLLSQQEGLQTIVVQADSPWRDGPELLDGADGAVVFLSEGAKWLVEDADRLAAFHRLAERRGGLTCLHWGMGTREAAPIAEFVLLFGACHGGPDRKYKVVKVSARPTTQPNGPRHPILNGLAPFEVHDEFYYALKRSPKPERFTPLIQVRIDDVDETVAWAWERSDGGRSFGFSGLHDHTNWKLAEYRRLVVQGILWSIDRPIPEAGVPVEVAPADIARPARPDP
jgi:Trehalose utilisation